MGKIALEIEVYSVGGEGTPVANKCCTKSRAEALGCKIKDGYSYASNQLIEQDCYEKSMTLYKGVMLAVSSGTPPYGVYPFVYMTVPSSNPGNLSVYWSRVGNSGTDYYYGQEVNDESDAVTLNNGSTGETFDETGNLCEIGYYGGGNNNWTTQSATIVSFTSEDF